MTQNRQKLKWLLPALIAAGVAFVSIYGPRVFAAKEDEDVSPNGYYRVEYLKPGFPYLFSLTKDMPRLIRLYDNRTGKLLGESDIVELSGNGKISWPSKYSPLVRVGMDVEFPASPEPD